jgi:ATP-dependent DNA ligase
MIIRLYKTDSKGKIRVWDCEAVTDIFNGIRYRDGLEEGKIKDWTLTKTEAKNIGKSNATTPAEQAVVLFQQTVDKKLREGYFKTKEEAVSIEKEFRPMLCPSGMKWQEWKSKVTYPAWVSPKLDGARCNAMMIDGKIVLKTRTGKIWKNCEHIKEQLKSIFDRYPNIILDGEFYNHKYKDNFEDLLSIIKKEKPTTKDEQLSAEDVEYHIYDYHNPADEFELSFMLRDDILYNNRYFITLFEEESIIHCKSKVVHNEEEFDRLHEKALLLGYEGTILRLDAPYEPDKRSKVLLKRKEVYDLEADILEIIEGEGTNTGICGKMKIRLDDGTEQEAGLGKGINHDQARYMLRYKDEFEGKRATFQYFGYTNSNKLRFPKFIRMRESVDM